MTYARLTHCPACGTDLTPQHGNLPEAREILAFFNQRLNTHYRPVAANLDLIRARLADGITPEQLRAIIAVKARQWKGTEMAKYLRPETIFRRSKCEQYLGELPASAFQDAET